MKKIIICLCLISFITVGCGCNKNTENEEITKPDFEINSNLLQEQEVEGLKIKDVSIIVEKDGNSRYSATVTNNTDQVYELSTIKAIFKNKDGNTIDTIVGVVGSSIAPSESRNLSFVIDKDLLDVYTIEYEIIK